MGGAGAHSEDHVDAPMANSSIVDRMIRASRLDEHLYEEVEHDPDATGQAAIVVVGTSIAAGIGGAGAGIVWIPVVAVISLLAWALYAWLTYFIGTRMLAGPDTSASWSELARTLGYANSPRALMIVAFVPVLGVIVGIVVSIWVLIATIIAIRAALDFSTGRAIGTAIIGWLAQAIVLGIAVAIST
jgi:hypothetical protein